MGVNGADRQASCVGVMQVDRCVEEATREQTTIDLLVLGRLAGGFSKRRLAIVAASVLERYVLFPHKFSIGGGKLVVVSGELH